MITMTAMTPMPTVIGMATVFRMTSGTLVSLVTVMSTGINGVIVMVVVTVIVVLRRHRCEFLSG